MALAMLPGGMPAQPVGCLPSNEHSKMIQPPKERLDWEVLVRSVRSITCAFVGGAALVSSLLPIPALAADVEEASAADGFNALSTFPEFASMADSAESDAPLVLQGAIEQITGAAMPGAQVLLWAWPSNQTVRDMPVGGELELVPMARTVADSAGKYELRATVTDLLRSLTSADGLDISLDVFHGDRHYTYLSQVTPTVEGKWLRELTGLAEPVTEAVEGAKNLLDLTLDRTKAAVEGGLGITGQGPVAADYRKPVPPGCTPFEKVDTRRVWTTVANATATGGVAAVMSYQRNSRTESSTGASLGGAFSINGSRSRTFGFKADYDPIRSTRTKPVRVDYRVRQEYVVLRRSCAKDFRGGEDVLYITSPLGSLTGGADFVESAQPKFSCTPGDDRTEPVKGVGRAETLTARAATVEGGVSFEPIPGSGFSGKALSGYDASTVVAFTFEGIPADKRFWCGHTSYPLAQGQRVQGFAK